MFSRRRILLGIGLGLPLTLTARSQWYDYDVGIFNGDFPAGLAQTELAQPPPRYRVEFFSTGGNGRIRIATWQPQNPNGANQTVLLALGYAEFIEKHFTTIGMLLDAGFGVAVFDWRGQGHSSRYVEDREVGYLPSFENHLHDLQIVFETLNARRSTGSLSIVAISMGGLVTLRALQQKLFSPSRTVLMVPLLEFAQGNHFSAGIADAAWFSGFSKDLVPGWIPLDLETTNGHFGISAEEHAAWASLLHAFPSLGLQAPSFKWVEEMAEAAIKAEHEFASDLPCPTLIVSAGNDIVVSNRQHERLANANRAVEWRLIEDAPHDVLLAPRPISDEAVSACIEWLSG